MSESLAWAAGFFDGEGCVLLVTRTRGRCTEVRLQITAVNTDIRPLHRFRELFGGSIQVVQHPGNKHGYKPSWAWVAAHRIAENALQAMLPWLLVKREQAIIALLARAIKRQGVRGTPDTQALTDLLWLKEQLHFLRNSTGLGEPIPSGEVR